MNNIQYDNLTPSQGATRRLLYHWVLYARCVEDTKLHETIKAKNPKIFKLLCEVHVFLNAKKSQLLQLLPPDMRNVVIQEMSNDDINELLTIFEAICDGDIKIAEEDKTF